MIGQADIDDQDVLWAASVLPRNHCVQCSSELVRGIGSSRPGDETGPSVDRPDGLGEC